MPPYNARVAAQIEGEDFAVVVRLWLFWVDDSAPIASGDPAMPAWAQHRLDELQVAIDEQLAHAP